MTSKAPEARVRIAQLGVTRNTMPALVDRMFEILRQDATTQGELDDASALIAQMKRRHKAEKCRNGMIGEPPCRSLQEAISDIRRRAEERT